MKRKYLIYLLTFLMAFSPAAVFADINDGEAADNAGNPVTEAVETAEPAAAEEVAAEAAAAEAAPEADDTALAPADEEVVQEEAKLDGDEETKIYGGDEECFWVEGSNRTRAQDKDGKPVYGLFKAQRKAGKLGLYYADVTTGEVMTTEGLISPTEGNQFTYTKISGETGWNVKSGGPYTYLIKKYSDPELGDDYYVTNVLEGLEPYDGNKYYIKEGTVRTNAGPQDFEGSRYYVQDGGPLQMTVGFTPDHKYYVKDAEGKVLTDKGKFQANDGKFYFAQDGGEIPSTAGLYSVGSEQYYVNTDGSIQMSGIVTTVDGRKYYIENDGAIRTGAGIVPYGGSLYAAEPGGAIHTTKGFYNAGGSLVYVANTDGVLVVNSAFNDGGKTYHALSNGVIAVGVHQWGNSYYYGDGSGAIRTKKGVISWNGNKYYVKKGGKITTNKKVKYKGKTYIAGSNGAFAKGIFTWKKNLYYANSKSIIRTKAGVFTYNGNRYYSRKGGKLYKNKLFTAKKKKYLAQSDGTLKAGYFAWKGKYYLTNSKCQIYTKAGIYTYNNKQYFAKKGGAMANSEFVEYKGNNYYVGSDGAIVKKAFTYRGIRITPNSSTGVISLEEYWKVFPEKAPQPEGN